MRAVQYRTVGGGPEGVDVPTPEPGPGQVRLKVTAAGLCHSDEFVMSLPEGAFPLPMTLGHEGVGVVDALGEGATGVSVGDAVAESTAEEEAHLLPLLAAHLPAGEWATACRAAGSTLSGREQMLVLGLVIEDASAIDRARVLAGVPLPVRTAWRAVGRRNFRAAVVRLRGAPPAL